MSLDGTSWNLYSVPLPLLARPVCVCVCVCVCVYVCVCVWCVCVCVCVSIPQLVQLCCAPSLKASGPSIDNTIVPQIIIKIIAIYI